MKRLTRYCLCTALAVLTLIAAQPWTTRAAQKTGQAAAEPLVEFEMMT